MWGSYITKPWGSAQSVVVSSSGEAEYCGMVKGASVALGLQSVLKAGVAPVQQLPLQVDVGLSKLGTLRFANCGHKAKYDEETSK